MENKKPQISKVTLWKLSTDLQTTACSKPETRDKHLTLLPCLLWLQEEILLDTLCPGFGWDKQGPACTDSYLITASLLKHGSSCFTP